MRHRASLPMCNSAAGWVSKLKSAQDCCHLLFQAAFHFPSSMNRSKCVSAHCRPNPKNTWQASAIPLVEPLSTQPTGLASRDSEIRVFYDTIAAQHLDNVQRLVMDIRIARA